MYEPIKQALENDIFNIISNIEVIVAILALFFTLGRWVYKNFNEKLNYNSPKYKTFIKESINKYSQQSAKLRSLKHTDVDRSRENEALDYARLIGFPNSLPKLKIDTTYTLKEKISDNVFLKLENAVKSKRESLQLNETQAILKVQASEEMEVNNTEVTVDLSDYAYIACVRDFIRKGIIDVEHAPKVITSGSLLVCPKKKKLVLQNRASDVDTHSDMIHTLGGAYQHPKHLQKNFSILNDNLNLTFTIIREIFEESSIILDKKNISKDIFLMKQVIDGYIQYYALYSIISPEELSMIEGSEEGNVITISFENLEEYLNDTNCSWVPSGKLHVLLWLALGAPGTTLFTRFSNKFPKKLFKKVISSYD